MPSSPAILEIFTDCTCPWCYFMSGRIAQLKKEYNIQIRRRMFPFRSDTPKDGLSLSACFSDDPLVVNERMRNLKETAEALGLPFGTPEMIYNSRLAQELGLWAETRCKGDAFLQALYVAYFVDSRNIARNSVLFETAASVGLPAEDFDEVIKAGTFKERVDRDWAMAEAMNILVLPTFVINGDRLVGAQPYRKLQRLIEKSGVVTKKG
ncbi:MAG: DsbA family protein [Deltaproteobacteria bacterium]|nr:DsbA family protein [Deltaproteobacteria bacterium]